MNPRLDELLRQRQLLVEHLAWLDEEIAQVSPPSDQPVYRPVPAPLAAQAPVERPVAAPEPPPIAAPATENLDEVASSILEQYQDQKGQTLSSAKRGVFLVFAALLGIFAACVAAFYLYEKTRRGH